MHKGTKTNNVAIILLILLAGLLIYIYVFLKHPKFGKLPSGERLERILRSPNYREGKIHNQSFTPQLAEGASYFSVLKKVLFKKSARSKPANVVPSVKTNLLRLRPDENILVWFGHSSYFLQIDGKTFLVDPVFSGAASPVKFTTRSFPGTDIYTADDMPAIDYLFISHDHWDHLDYETVLKLKHKVKKVVTGLGTGAHLEYWGYNPGIIEERDWNEEIRLENGFVVNTIPARHFSGRGLKANQSLWTSFVLKTPSLRIFLGGDSGYDSHFEAAGKAFGPFDLAILECGQYNEDWRYIHMLPNELIKAATQLQAKKLMPVHWGKFSLALHAWDEPIIKITALSKEHNISLVTPMIGEAVDLKEPGEFSEWWKTIA